MQTFQPYPGGLVRSETGIEPVTLACLKAIEGP
jgi:hypothetical protein